MATLEIIHERWTETTSGATATTVLTVPLPSDGCVMAYWVQNVGRKSGGNNAYGGKVDGICRRDSGSVSVTDGFAPRVIGTGAGNVDTTNSGTNLIVTVTGEAGSTYYHNGYFYGIMRVP